MKCYILIWLRFKSSILFLVNVISFIDTIFDDTFLLSHKTLFLLLLLNLTLGSLIVKKQSFSRPNKQIESISCGEWIPWKKINIVRYGKKRYCGNIFVHIAQPYVQCALSSSPCRHYDCGWSSDGERAALPALYAAQLPGHRVQRDPTGPHRHEHALHSAQRRHQNKGALGFYRCRIKHTKLF